MDQKDELAIQRFITVVEERMVNPFEADTAADEEKKQPPGEYNNTRSCYS